MEDRAKSEHFFIRKGKEITASVRRRITSTADTHHGDPKNINRAPEWMSTNGRRLWAESDNKAAEWLTEIKKMKLKTDDESGLIISYYLVGGLTVEKINASESYGSEYEKKLDRVALVLEYERKLDRILARLFSDVNQRNEAKKYAGNSAFFLKAIKTKNPAVEAPALQLDENIRNLDELIQTSPEFPLFIYRAADPEPAAN